MRSPVHETCRPGKAVDAKLSWAYLVGRVRARGDRVSVGAMGVLWKWMVVVNVALQMNLVPLSYTILSF